MHLIKIVGLVPFKSQYKVYPVNGHMTVKLVWWIASTNTWVSLNTAIELPLSLEQKKIKKIKSNTKQNKTKIMTQNMTHSNKGHQK